VKIIVLLFLYFIFLHYFQSKLIADAVYESLWYDLPSNQRKIITFVIMRSQKQLMITAGRVTNLSLETFTSVTIK